MKKIIVFLFVILILILTGCELIPFAAESQIDVSYSSNPAYDPDYTSAYGWHWSVKITISENAGIPVEIGNYGPDGEACISKFCVNNYQTVQTFKYYKDDIESWFGTANIDAFSSISSNADFYTFSYDEGMYIETYYGKDENGTIVECTDTLILINNTKK